jgi:hypothetical protein
MHHQDDHFTIISQLDDHNYISYCGHDIVHLTWGMATLRFRPASFSHLARMIENYADTGGNRPIRSGTTVLIREENGSHILMFNDVGLRLAPQEFIPFVDLLLAGGKWMDQLQLQRIDQRKQQSQTENKSKPSRIRFSLN